jgi:hypothetical protein
MLAFINNVENYIKCTGLHSPDHQFSNLSLERSSSSSSKKAKKMKLTVFALAVFCGVALVHSAKLTKEEEERIFNNWIRKHKIKVPSHEHGQKWKENLLKKLEDIESHNEDFRSGKVSFERTLNHFSHVHPEEFHKTGTGVTIPDNYKHDESKVIEKQTRPKRDADDLPEYFNWADRGVIQPIQDQGQCSSCYGELKIIFKKNR